MRRSPDVCIVGAGIIGLTLALALRRRGLSIRVLTAGDAMAEASTAAAGMLAVEDPDNPPELLALSRFSRNLYPQLLDVLASVTPLAPAFQTHRTLQAVRETSPTHTRPLHSFLPRAAQAPSTFRDLSEASLDPRELAPALLAAVRAAGVEVQPATTVLSLRETGTAVHIRTSTDPLEAAVVVDCTGAWSLASALVPSLQVSPRKGQMLTVPSPPSLASGIVIRLHDLYLVPRLHGPRAGHTVIGATVEDAGFDRSLDPAQLRALLAHAADLLPELRGASILSQWSGLRPATADLLPAIGPLAPSGRLFVASGHYRNGILLAPGTAELLAQQITGEPLALSLAPFSPGRFA